MSFGIPCDTAPQPQQVFQLTAELDTYCASVVQSIMTALQGYVAELDYAINTAFVTLQRSVNVRMGQIDSKINSLVSMLQSELTSLASVSNTDLSSFVYQVATLTEQPQQAVIEQPLTVLFPTVTETGLPGTSTPSLAGASGPTTSTLGQPGSPFTPPPTPSTPLAPVIPFPRPPTPPGQPGGSSPQIPPPAITVSINGAPVSVTQAVSPLFAGPQLVIGGQSYQPVLSVWLSQLPLPTTEDGTPQFPVSVDTQQDGTVLVTVGPMSVALALPSNNPANPGAQCPLDFAPVNPITGL
jgi:hypothetical protein